MKLWNTNASPLLSGARSGPVGTPVGMNDAANDMFDEARRKLGRGPRPRDEAGARRRRA